MRGGQIRDASRGGEGGETQLHPEQAKPLIWCQTSGAQTQDRICLTPCPVHVWHPRNVRGLAGCEILGRPTFLNPLLLSPEQFWSYSGPGEESQRGPFYLCSVAC